MTIVLEFVNDDNVRRDPDEPGAMFNPSSNIYVQLRALSMAELRQEWKTFDRLLRKAFIDLFSMKISEIRTKYGALDISEKGITGRTDIEFGLAFTRAAARFTHFHQRQVVKCLAAKGVVATRGVGGVGPFVENLERNFRLGLITALLESDTNLDEILNLNQTSLIGDREIGQYLASTREPAAALERIAENTDSFFNDQQTAPSGSHARGAVGYSAGLGLRSISRCAGSGFNRSRA